MDIAMVDVMNNVLRTYVTNKKEYTKLICTFKECSKDNQPHYKRYLVESCVKCLNFDELVSQLYSGGNFPKSVDSLTEANGYLYLIEFKTGDQVTKYFSREKLIKNVSGKLNDSDQIIYDHFLNPINDSEFINDKLRFYLVVDSETNGAHTNVMATELAKLSFPKGMGTSVQSEKLQEILVNLKKYANNPKHFNDIDIWLSSYFDSYLELHGITSIDCSV